MLEVHDPANCSKVLPDLVGLSVFTYGSHYCSVDNRHHATTLACGYFNSGIRVFDIRDPYHPKELAYFNAPVHPAPGGGAGSNYAMSAPAFDSQRGQIWYSDGNDGFYVVRVTNGAWPFPPTVGAP